jgi:hypothetical protein
MLEQAAADRESLGFRHLAALITGAADESR